MHEGSITYSSDECRMAGEFLEAWLARDDWTPAEWVDDFTGLNLPSLPPEEPFLWFLEGLGAGSRRVRGERELARRLARVLDLAPDRQQLDQDRRQALYNVLVLCSEVRRPELLAGPLKLMLIRASLPEIHLGYNLRFALRQALMMNPPGRELEPVWVAMARGEIHPFLPSDRYDAFNGVLLLPQDDKGDFAVAAMSEVLNALVEALESHEKGETERYALFAAMLDKVTECWVDERYLVRFWREAFDAPWRTWALVCIAMAFGVKGAPLREILKICRDIPPQNGSYRLVRGALFNTASIFARQTHEIRPGFVSALNVELSNWRRQAHVPQSLSP
jgi:hypothetical protein